MMSLLIASSWRQQAEGAEWKEIEGMSGRNQVEEMSEKRWIEAIELALAGAVVENSIGSNWNRIDRAIRS